MRALEAGRFIVAGFWQTLRTPLMPGPEFRVPVPPTPSRDEKNQIHIQNWNNWVSGLVAHVQLGLFAFGGYAEAVASQYVEDEADKRIVDPIPLFLAASG
jgi:hypothetical protein